MRQVAKLGFKINQIIFLVKYVGCQNMDSKLILQNSNHFEKPLKIIYHLGFIKKKKFLFQKSLISFLRISIKSNNYQIIIETHKRLGI